MKVVKLMKASLLLIAIFSVSGTAVAIDGASLYKSKACASCHGAHGNAPIQPNYPKIASQSKDYLIQQLKDFKSSKRKNAQSATMTGIMAGVSEKELILISEYLSILK